MASHRLWRIPFIGRCTPWAAIRDRPPQRAKHGAEHMSTCLQHLPHMAQLADFMRLPHEVHAAIPAVAVHA